MSWPYEIVETFFGYRIAFLHYPLDVVEGGFASVIPDPSGEDLDALFAGTQADLIFYGHHHPAVDHSGRARYINPGALGCGPDASARFTVVNLGQAVYPTIHHHTAAYDRTPLYEALVRRDVPAHAFVRQAFFPWSPEGYDGCRMPAQAPCCSRHRLALRISNSMRGT